MRKVTFYDSDGYLRSRLVRDSDPDSAAPMGIPCDPPDLKFLDWETAKRDLHNLLAARGITTLDDIQLRQANLRGAIQDALYRPLLALFRNQSVINKEEE
jgi:hypothetical protein